MQLLDERRRGPWPWIGGLALLTLFGWFAFVRGARVPILGWIDLAIHEFGHLVATPLPDLVMMMMGSGFQILVPLSLAAVFTFHERDRLGAAICLGWAATSMQDASIYIGDAPYQRLQLIGGLHDWAYVLDRFDALDRAEGLARLVWTLGLVTLICALALCAWGLATRPARGSAGAAPPAPAHPAPEPPVRPPADAGGYFATAGPTAAEPPPADR